MTFMKMSISFVGWQLPRDIDFTEHCSKLNKL